VPRAAFGVLVGAVISQSAGAAVVSVPVGAVTQLPGTSGCLYEPPTTDDAPSSLQGACVQGRALTGPSAIVVSPDGRNVYVASNGADAIASFARNPANGVLQQLPGSSGCVSDASELGCSAVYPLNSVNALAVSPDGKNLYAASTLGLAIFARHPGSGALVQLAPTRGCVSSEPVTDERCTSVVAMDDPSGIAVSPDGRNVYVSSGSGYSIAVFARESADGGLRQLPGTTGCIGPVVGEGEEDVPSTPALPCTTVSGLSAPPASTTSQKSPIAVSPDGRHVYVASYGAVAVLARVGTTGALSQDRPDCLASSVAKDESLGACGEARGLGASNGIAVSPDGRAVVIAATPIVTRDLEVDSGVAVFRRDPVSGSLTQMAGSSGCVTALGAEGCSSGRGLATDSEAPYSLNALALSLDGRTLYVGTMTSSEESGTISVFSRTSAGALVQLPGAFGCLGAQAGCASVRGLTGASAIAASPDGRYVYGTGYFDKSVAAFATTRPTAEVVVRKAGPGTVTSTPPGIACGKRCAGAFPLDSSVTLVARPSRGSTFSVWGGLCRGKAHLCKIAVRRSGTVTAVFRKN
jgi:DNA-binding beta-propeller fold protein YncE